MRSTETSPETANAQGRQRLIGTLPFAAAVLVLINGAYMFLVALGNITDYDTNFAFVQHVLSMDTTNFGAAPGEGLDPDIMWRAITDPAIWHTAYIGLIIWEALTAIALIAGFVLFIIAFRNGNWRAAKLWSSVGLLMMVILFFGGFITIGGEWFQMWRSPSWNGLDPAFRNAVLASITLVLVHLPSGQWRQKTTL